MPQDPRMDPDRQPVAESKVGDAVLALLLLPCVAVTGAVLVAGAFLLVHEGTAGPREIFTYMLGLALFPLCTRAFYVVAARLFGKIIEPLVPWWLAVPLSPVFAAGLIFAVLRGSVVRPGPAFSGFMMLIGAPYVLYRAQHRG